MNLEELAEKHWWAKERLKSSAPAAIVATELSGQYAWQVSYVPERDEMVPFSTDELEVMNWRSANGWKPVVTLPQASERHGETRTGQEGTSGQGRHAKPLESLTAPQGPRMLFIDVEMTPSLVHTWELHEANIWHERIIIPTEMICFSAKWAGQETQFYSVHHDGKQGMLRSVWELLDAADMVVHYWGKSFDIPCINTELLLAEMPPPSPFQQIDLCLAVKKKFNFPSNKLDYVSKVLGTSGKNKSIGYDNWVGCINGDPAAWETMKSYSMQDVEVLPEVYEKIKPWIPSHPSFAPYTGNFVCPACGSDRLERRGFAYTTVSKYQRYQCKECGKWSRDSKRISGVHITNIAE